MPEKYTQDQEVMKAGLADKTTYVKKLYGRGVGKTF